VSSQIYDIEKGCHTNCVTFLAFLTTYFDEHFFWKDILWAPAYNNNTLPDTGKIESYVWEKNCNI
jgi:hypothetical protein